MDLPRLALLKQIEFRLSQEGDGALYLARDRSTGKIFSLSRPLLAALRSARASLSGQSGIAPPTGNRARDLFQFLHILQDVRKSETHDRKSFNPVFMSFALFDVGRFQARLAPMARLLVSPLFPALMAILALACVVLGVRNDWAIMDTFDHVFSLEAILTFGLMAPFLKIIHELGHVLTATRYGVAVRKAGVFLISFYPLPYVDCTDADFSAPRRHRIAISLAGIVVDVTIGMIAFIGWHFTRGTYIHTLLGNVFVFSTLNSVLFNANPLVKLDGYFAFADAIGNRNLYTKASARLSGLTRYIFTLGQGGALPRSRGDGLMAAYGAATVLYRLNMLFNIALGLAPKYLGAGLVCVVWGAIVMFHAPLQAMVLKLIDRPDDKGKDGDKDATSGGTASPTGNETSGPNRLRRLHPALRAGVPLAVLLLLSLIPLPFSTVVPVTLDEAQSYSVSLSQDGFLKEIRPAGRVVAGEVLGRFVNPGTEQELAVNLLELREAALALQTARGLGEAKAQAALKQFQTLEAERKQLESEIDSLTVKAAQDGYFIPHMGRTADLLVTSGHTVGALYPDGPMALFSGVFPERYVSMFQESLVGAELRIGETYHRLDPVTLRLQTILSFEEASGSRGYRVLLPLQAAPSAHVGEPGLVRFRFAAGNSWAHLTFWYDNLLANYRQSQLADREKYLADE